MTIAPRGHSETQRPHSRQAPVSMRTICPTVTAPVGHASAHRPQRVHLAASMTATSFPARLASAGSAFMAGAFASRRSSGSAVSAKGGSPGVSRETAGRGESNGSRPEDTVLPRAGPRPPRTRHLFPWCMVTSGVRPRRNRRWIITREKPASGRLLPVHQRITPFLPVFRIRVPRFAGKSGPGFASSARSGPGARSSPPPPKRPMGERVLPDRPQARRTPDTPPPAPPSRTAVRNRLRVRRSIVLPGDWRIRERRNPRNIRRPGRSWGRVLWVRFHLLVAYLPPYGYCCLIKGVPQFGHVI